MTEHVRIPLLDRSGKPRAHALVDFEDGWLKGLRWHLSNNGGYAHHSEKVNGQIQVVQMHRVILGLRPGDGLFADHINRNPLDNRRANLRAVTPAQNGQNRSASDGTTSRFRGVTWHVQCQKWVARVMVNGRSHYLGLFESEVGAAAACEAFRADHMPYSEDAAAA